MKRNAGLTMIELIVATGVFASVMAMAMHLTIDTTRSISEGTGYIKSQIAAAKMLDRIAEDLHSAQYGTMSVPTSGVPFTGATIQFRRIQSYFFGDATNAAAPVLYPNTIVYRWVPNEGPIGGLGNNGIDNDDNGVIDDGRIVREEYTTNMATLLSTEEMITGIDFGGLVFSRLDGVQTTTMLGARVRMYLRTFYYAQDNTGAANTNTDRVNGRTRKRAISQDYETVVSLRN